MNPLMLTPNQIQVPTDINPLLNTTADCHRFVTEFFDVISQSAPHIYHSALLLAPKSSVVRKLYGQHICSPTIRVVTGIPESWDSCSATVETTSPVAYIAWSPCGKFIAASFHEVDIVGVWDSTTLERVSDLRSPTMPVEVTPASLAFSPDGHLLASAYDPRIGHTRSVLAHTSLSILTSLYRLSVYTPYHIVVWDIQTGMAINNFSTWDLGRIIFSWDQDTITFITNHDFHTHDRLSGEQVSEGELLPSYNHQLGAQWVHEKSLQFAISFKTDQEHVISIQELQPTSDPPLHIVKSFPVLPQDGAFSFSPVSFHASFVSQEGVVILDVRNLKVLLKTAAPFYYLAGSFSHDGQFFAWGGIGGDIYIWENTSTGYVARSNLRPRFSWNGFSWSTTSISILCWGERVIQLLYPENFLGLTSSDVANYVQYSDHLVAYSADWTHIVIGKHRGSLITVLDLFGTIQQSIDTNLDITSVNIVGDTIFVIDESRNRLSSWHLITGGQINSTCSVRRENIALHFHMYGLLALSNNCTEIAGIAKEAAFLYDVQAQKILSEIEIEGHVLHIQFSPDGSQLWLIITSFGDGGGKSYCVELDRTKDLCFGNVTIEDLGDEWSLDSLFRSPDQCRIVGRRSKWVSDPRGNILWLPLSWRKDNGVGTRWDGNFLALLSSYHPEPIIIEFQQ